MMMMMTMMMMPTTLMIMMKVLMCVKDSVLADVNVQGVLACICQEFATFFWDHLSILIHFRPNLGDCLDGASHVTAMRFPQYL